MPTILQMGTEDYAAVMAIWFLAVVVLPAFVYWASTE